MDSKSTSKENWWERAWYFLKNHSGLTVIIAAAILLQTISAVQYYYMRNLLADELEKRAEIEMTTKAVIVKNALIDNDNVRALVFDAQKTFTIEISNGIFV